MSLLQIEEDDSGIFYGTLDLLEEGDGLLAVDQAMIVGQSHVHHGANLHLAAHRHGSDEGQGRNMGLYSDKGTLSWQGINPLIAGDDDN